MINAVVSTKITADIIFLDFRNSDIFYVNAMGFFEGSL